MAAAQGDDVLREAAQDAQLAADGFVVRAVPTGEGGGVPDGHGGGHAVQEPAVGGGVQFLGIGGEVADVFEQVLTGLPFEEAALAPFIEVLFADGFASEVAGQEVLDVGRGIEPVEEDAAILVVGEAEVEFIAQGARETGDFSFAKHNL